MTETEHLTQEEFARKTIDVIASEFGLTGLARFIMTFRSSTGDYTADRQNWPNGITLEEIKRDVSTIVRANPPVHAHRIRTDLRRRLLHRG